MTNWIIITTDDLNAYLVAAQASAIRTAATALGQADRFTVVMPTVADRIRRKIESCHRNQVSATANAIPPELKQTACLLIIQAMQTSIPGLDLTEDQKTLIKTCEMDLNRIAECKDVVSIPTDPLTPGEAQVGNTVEIVRQPARITRDRLRGI